MAHEGTQFFSQLAYCTYVWCSQGWNMLLGCMILLWCQRKPWCMAAIEFTIPTSTFWNRRHFPEFQKSRKKGCFLSEQLHSAWEGHSRKRVHIEVSEKNKVQEGCTIKNLLPWKDACLAFPKAEMFSQLWGAMWQAKTLPSLSSCANAKIMSVQV